MAEDRAPSALADAVARVGDRWSLLIVDALLGGPRRFGQLEEDIPGIAPNILSQRLKHLERDAILVARPYLQRPPRFEYELTGAGRDLGGALRLLTEWGAGGFGEGGPRHAACGTPLQVRWYCPTCARVVEDLEESELHHV